jgi:preprotein translocase subunit Sss1
MLPGTAIVGLVAVGFVTVGVVGNIFKLSVLPIFVKSIVMVL